jgi:hypothetical protein
MSIAAGVDFGHFRRIPELVDLNFHEEMILALNTVYFAAVKISSNEFGHVNYSQSRIKGHFILIPDNSFEEVVKDFGRRALLDIEFIKHVIQVYILDPTGTQFDFLSEKAFGTSTLLARAFVLHQRATIQCQIHSAYQGIFIPLYETFQQQMQEALSHLKRTAKHVVDDHDLQFESTIGSDVAQAQSTEVPQMNYAIHPAARDDQVDDISWRFSYIMSTEPETTEEDRHLGQLRALERLAHADGSPDDTAAHNAFDYDPEETADFSANGSAFHDGRSCDE